MNISLLKIPSSFLLISFAFLFLSCQSSVEFDSLEYNKSKGKYLKNNKPYSGKAIEKNQVDDFLRKAEYNNGYLVYQKKWKYPMGNKVLVEDMKYKNGKENTGFKIEIGNYDHVALTTSRGTVKNGELQNLWKLNVQGLFDKSSVLQIVANEQAFKDKDIKKLCSDNKIQFSSKNVDQEKLEKFLKCVKDQDLEGFEIFAMEK